MKLSSVRSALDYVERHFGDGRPLISQLFQTDGLDLFVERYGELINASKAGQRAMKEIVGVYLKRIEWDTSGLPIRLYPFTRVSDAESSHHSDPRIVVMNPTVSFGRPVALQAAIFAVLRSRAFLQQPFHEFKESFAPVPARS